MRIGELARSLGVSADTVRYYEKEGLLSRPARAENGYRDYGAQDVEHLRLLLDLRRMDLPLDAAAQLASWCHSGHCDQTTQELPRQLAGKRQLIAERLASLQQLDERIAQLERHLARRSLEASGLEMVSLGATACCSAAAAVEDGACACCAEGTPAHA